MGCDIHLYVEKKNELGVWESVEEFKTEEYDDEVHYYVERKNSFYNGRNYNLFAILADVRNGRGFAGVKTGEGFNPISEPKGIPEDVSEMVEKLARQWDCDRHSHSYFTVEELLAYDWTQTTTLWGVVSAREYEQYDRMRNYQYGPDSYSGSVSGPSVKHVSEQEMKNLLESIKDSRGWVDKEKLKEHTNVFTSVSWEVPYYSAAGSFLSETIWKLLKVGSPDKVRIVFWFDN